MKVLFLGGTSSRSSGGIFNTSTSLGRNLVKNHGYDVQYLTCEDEYSEEDRIHYSEMPVYNYKIFKCTSKLALSPDIHGLMNKISPDLVHTQCMWMYMSYANSLYHKKFRKPYIVQPHGMLDIWQLKSSRIKKKIVLTLYEKENLKNASCIYALCDEEYKAIRDFGLKNPVAIIPNGVELPSISHINDNKWNLPSRKGKTLLFLSRIHPKKGLEVLLNAWCKTIPSSHDWQLVIAGDTKDYRYLSNLNQLTDMLNIRSSVHFIGGQYGDEKSKCFLKSDAFVLPSYSEGLPMAILEAWSHKLPVLATPFCNIPEGFEKGAAIKIGTDPDSIALGINKLIALSSDQLNIIGYNGYKLVNDKFTWRKVAESTDTLYKWIYGLGDKPDFVYDS
ncbi:poly(glycerol-phosphate) alpha-glucosyltransferase [Spirosoma oryzae]|uniref:Poly(Glycerol-phosphate) alpha-glucosyltransferase n=1 Tax=Spirosoma oryzae TaxID=1469603 RepID=A0A2T0TET5_9BACT|nr:glycosyltransferase [Spirosoma oryzae]PRY44173.1 poly(glycerol-phosphate) alpha-glucosyltransferase [Spirosoma oryzae]